MSTVAQGAKLKNMIFDTEGVLFGIYRGCIVQVHDHFDEIDMKVSNNPSQEGHICLNLSIQSSFEVKATVLIDNKPDGDEYDRKTVQGSFKVASFADPNRCCFNSKGQLLFVDQYLMLGLVDLKTETVTKLVEAGYHVEGENGSFEEAKLDRPGAMCCDPSTDLIYVCCGDRTIKCIDLADKTVRTVTTNVLEDEFRGMTYNAITKKLFLSTDSSIQSFDLPKSESYF